MRSLLLLAIAAFTFATAACKSQEIKSPPGQFDYYVLNMSWSPEFCDTLKTLTPDERASGGKDLQCEQPHAFVLHGLWTQNNDGTYPGYCSQRPGPRNPERNLDMTPNLALLRHEWAKHGTCTMLSPEAFFATARQAYTSIVVPETFKRMDEAVMLRPDDILGQFYRTNPDFPQGSFALSCGNNRFTAIEACFDKQLHPIACTNLRSCRANVVRVTPEASGSIVR